MSKYTMELRELFTPIKFNPPLYTREQVEGFFKDYELSDYLTSEQISTIETSGVWNKNKLASKIVDHYYMQEIGSETIGLFKLRCKTSMNELMEEYLPLIYSASIEYDPLINVDYTESFTRTANVDNTGRSVTNNSASGSVSNTGRSVSDSTNTGSSLSVNSDTPQGQISKTSILAGSYASNTTATETSSTINNTTNTVSSSSNTNTSEDVVNTTSGSDSEEEYTKTMKGNSGVSATAQKMIEQYRNNIRAIDREIIEKLGDLFMGIW